MDFNKPLTPAQGFVLYNVLMTMMDDFVAEYSEAKQGKEYPSLRIMTDLFLTYISYLKDAKLEITGNSSTKESFRELLEHIETERETNKVLDSRKFGLFVDSDDTELSKLDGALYPDDIKPLILNAKDKTWLGSVRIKHD
jgi:hypothetical protein